MAEALRRIMTNDPLHSQVDQAIEALLERNDPPAVFRSGDRLVRLAGDVDDLRVDTIPQGAMKERLSKVAQFYQPVRDSVKAVHPPNDVVRLLLDRPRADEAFPVLERVVSAPVFGKDGTLSVEPGYHPSARVWYQPTPEMAGLSSPWPREEQDVKAALFNIDLMLDGFPFDSAASRAHAIGEMLLPFVRSMVPGPTPLHLHTAPREGTGKGLLAQVLTWPSVGDDCLVSPAHTEEEWDKRIGAELGRGRAAVVWDNVKGEVSSGSLELALTSATYVSRILGFSRMGSYPVRCLWVMTSNNAQLSAGLARRSVMVRLDAQMQRPETRTGWKIELPQWAKKHRRDLVAACHTIVADWVDEGKPLYQGTLLGSFEGWSMVIGGILENAGVEGFLENREEVLARTAEDDEVGDFFVAWAESGLGFMSSKRLQSEMEFGALADYVPSDMLRDSRGRERDVAYVLRELRDRVYGDWKLVYDENARPRTWGLVRVGD